MSPAVVEALVSLFVANIECSYSRLRIWRSLLTHIRHQRDQRH